MNNNYKLIADEQELKSFIDILPDCNQNEMYYVALFARKKYEKTTSGLTADKTQLKRFIATKDRIIAKIKQLEVVYGAYTQPDQKTPIAQETLALYITINPRDLHKASLHQAKEVVAKMAEGKSLGNPKAKAFSAIQVSTSNKKYYDVDIDVKDEKLLQDIIEVVGLDAAPFYIETRGGFHLPVLLENIPNHKKNKWYNEVKDLLSEDKGQLNGDNMVPIPGTYQGGFIPKLFKL